MEVAITTAVLLVLLGTTASTYARQEKGQEEHSQGAKPAQEQHAQQSKPAQQQHTQEQSKPVQQQHAQQGNAGQSQAHAQQSHPTYGNRGSYAHGCQGLISLDSDSESVLCD
jgi:hypothetical protein